MKNATEPSAPSQRAGCLEALTHRTTPWDVLVVGGGITGAGVAREAARRGLAVLLVEQRDFAWGTSSRSSKMVHGGLRYLAQGDFKLTRDALRERERLLREAPTLVTRAGYFWTHRKGQSPGRIALGLALELYDRMAGIRDHHFVPRREYLERVPGLNSEGLQGATYFTDSLVDDARLVLRVLDEARADGALAINYMRVTGLLHEGPRVAGARIEDVVSTARPRRAASRATPAPVMPPPTTSTSQGVLRWARASKARARPAEEVVVGVSVVMGSGQETATLPAPEPTAPWLGTAAPD